MENRDLYPTYITVAPGQSGTVVQSLLQLMISYNWTTVTVICDIGNLTQYLDAYSTIKAMMPRNKVLGPSLKFDAIQFNSANSYQSVVDILAHVRRSSRSKP